MIVPVAIHGSSQGAQLEAPAVPEGHRPVRRPVPLRAGRRARRATSSRRSADEIFTEIKALYAGLEAARPRGRAAAPARRAPRRAAASARRPRSAVAGARGRCRRGPRPGRAGASRSPAGAAVRLVPVGTFERPTYVTAPPGDAQRVVVVEQGGRVRLIKDGARAAARVPRRQRAVDRRSRLAASPSAGCSRWPSRPTTRRAALLYAYYTGEGQRATCGSTSSAAAADPDVIDAATRRPVLEIPHDQRGNHNGGQLQFGPDGMLYVGTGDGGGGRRPGRQRPEPDAAPRRPSSACVNQSPLLGKILRIDPRGGTPYAVPADNPFAAPARGGLVARPAQPVSLLVRPRDRRPDRSATSGRTRYEEINFAPAGGEARAAARTSAGSSTRACTPRPVRRSARRRPPATPSR